MDLGIQGKSAIICASSRGLGKACAYSLAINGVNITLNGRNEKVLEIEGSGGTKKMLKKIKKIKNFTNGVLVKLPKKKQDLRIDLPAIGL